MAGRDRNGYGVEKISSMKVPSLVRQLRSILDRYPNNGQIIKELVQNAEDAEAREMKILWDRRNVNQDKCCDDQPYNKFFTGPAMCLYNSAEFSQEDWENIKKIQSSNKEKDPLKVGRFGLGFKSVFHITDYPCIISGNQLLLMNPLGEVCIEIQLSQLKDCTNLNIQCFLKVLEFLQQSLQEGKFPGTLFWFPLRREVSPLSESIYVGDEIGGLLTSFKLDAVNTLLFLTHLQSVEVYERSTQTHGIVFSASKTNLVESQTSFSGAVAATGGRFSTKSLKTVKQLSIQTSSLQEGCIENDSSHWLIVNLYKGGQMTSQFKDMIDDDSLSYSPSVGVATCLQPVTADFPGHIFCFLPLPQPRAVEHQSLTNLPVHVNGFFALSQNRSELKWPTDDQTKVEKAMVWNKCLLTEALPEAYSLLLDQVVQLSVQKGNTPDWQNVVYSCIPNASAVVGKWEELVNALIVLLRNSNLVFTENRGGCWIKVQDALFASFEDYNVSPEVQQTVKNVLKLYSQAFTDVPQHVLLFARKICKTREITPHGLSLLLTSNHSLYEKLPSREKLKLLQFLMCTQQFENISGLKLLPLANGDFTTFGQEDPVYVVTKEEEELFPSQEQMLMCIDKLPGDLQFCFRSKLQIGLYQLKTLSEDSIMTLITQSCRRLGSREDWHGASSATLAWLKRVWMYFLHKSYSFQDVKALPLLPAGRQGQWDLHCLEDTLLLRELGGQRLTDGVTKSLEKLSVTVIDELPPWVRYEDVREFIHDPSSESVFACLGQLPQISSELFNKDCVPEDTEEFASFLGNGIKLSTISNEAKKLLRKMQIFETTDKCSCVPKNVCVEELNQMLDHENDSLPVRFPTPYLVNSTVEERTLAEELGVHFVSEADLVLKILEVLQLEEQDIYSTDDKKTFMMWLLQELPRFRNSNNNGNIITGVKSVRFLKAAGRFHKTTELFDPTEENAKELLMEEDVFPEEEEFIEEPLLSALKNTGLRCMKSLRKEDLLTIGKTLDEMSANGRTEPDVKEKAQVFVKVLEKFSSLLDAKSIDELKKLHCIFPQFERDKSYPAELPWYKSHNCLTTPEGVQSAAYSQLIGSVRSVVECQMLPTVADIFKWHNPPEISDIVLNLKVVVDNFQISRKPQFLMIIASTYKELSKRNFQEVKIAIERSFGSLTAAKFVWSGYGFVSPNGIFLEDTKYQVDLYPYRYQIPEEVSSEKLFFAELGCHKEVDIDVLLDVLKEISVKHEATEVALKDCSKDLELAVRILNRIAENVEDIIGRQEDIFVPVHTADDGFLEFRPASECVYSDAEWLKEMHEDEEELKFVHGHISDQKAKQLGVRSLTRMLLSDTDPFEEWGQEESLTRRIETLLKESYVDGFTLPKEIFQNADDAGATEVRFLYDERENLDARSKLLDEHMADFQGPALWAFNNENFSEKDFENIQKLNAGTKMDDSSKIGKFGLGFCAVYNLTDVPSILSGDNIAFFDPHTIYLGKAIQGKKPGLKINFAQMNNRMMLKRMSNQFKPFQGIFGCDIQNTKHFHGTLLRLPFRTKKQASVSEIRDKPYTIDDCQNLLKMLIEKAANMLIFSQNVNCISLYHLPKHCLDPSKPVLVYKAEKSEECLIHSKCDVRSSMLNVATDVKKSDALLTNTFSEFRKVNIHVEIQPYPLLSSKKHSSTGTWLVYWAIGNTQSALEMSAATRGAVPLGSVAILTKETGDGRLLPLHLNDVPFGFYREAHVFTFLPLPISTSMDIHLNGVFAITSDRKNLIASSEDAKDDGKHQWNQCMMGDVICKAYLALLQELPKQKYGLSDQYIFHEFWPANQERDLLCLEKSFYRNIAKSGWKVFENRGHWYSLKECMFLDPDWTKEHPDLGRVALEFLSEVCLESDVTFIDLPYDKVEAFRMADSDSVIKRTMFVDDFILKKFLPNISSAIWSKNRKERDKIVLFAIQSRNPELRKGLANTSCIPTDTDNLIRPNELIDPRSNLAKLFDLTDGRFPVSKPVNFREEQSLDRLVELGMMTDHLSPALVIDRAHSVVVLAESCPSCSLDRCKYLVDYLAHGGLSHLGIDDSEHLKEIAFLPVLDRPTDWPAKWKADCIDHVQIKEARTSCKHDRKTQKLKFAKPNVVFCFRLKDLVSCTEIVLDNSRSYLIDFEKVLAELGVQGNVETKTVIQQLCLMSAATKDTNRVKDVRKSCKKVYKHLNMVFMHTEDQVYAGLRDLEILLIGEKFVNPRRVAMNLKHDCSPDLFKPEQPLCSYTTFLEGLSVGKHIDPKVVIQILVDKKQQYAECVLSLDNVQHICHLLMTLSDSMDEQNITFDELVANGCGDIYAPDVNRVLQKTTDMCYDDSSGAEDDDELFDGDMLFIHGKFSKEIAKKLGVITKTYRAFEDNSVPFGQKEELVTRIHGLLQGYPCDSGIMKELIQNADDAKATEIHFVKDYRTHKTDKIFAESFKPLQGPALCVFNNSAFSPKDLKGIQNLGKGSKQEDPSKTGQYGVGFNAVYNLTDAPSFITKGPEVENHATLCFFDPTCKHLPKLHKHDPGRRFINLKKLRKSHPDVFEGYLETAFFPDCNTSKGTLFRIPLRTEPSDISRHTLTPQILDKLLDEFKEDMPTSLLFLKHISKITISNISTGKLVEEFSVRAEVSDSNEEKRKDFFHVLKQVAEDFKKDRCLLLNRTFTEKGYQMQTYSSTEESVTWHVVQRLGYDDPQSVPDCVKSAFKHGDLGLLPHGGIAIQLKATESRKIHTSFMHETNSNSRGHAFCFLPLPIKTGLPVQVHGHFALDHEARRNLWSDDSSYRSQWNFSLLNHVIAPAYVTALKALLDFMFEGTKGKEIQEQTADMNVRKLEKAFPRQAEAKDIYWKKLCIFVFQLIFDKNEPLFPMLLRSVSLHQTQKHKKTQKKAIVAWTSLRKEGFQFEASFYDDQNNSADLIRILQRLGMRIICSSEEIRLEFKAARRPTMSLAPKIVVEFLKSFNSHFPDKVLIDRVDVLVSETNFQTVKDVYDVLKYCRTAGNLESLPLLVTNDGYLRQFNSSKRVFCSWVCDLFPMSGYQFVHRDFVSLGLMKSCNTFRVQDIPILLSENLDSKYKGGRCIDWIPDNTFITDSWLCDLWKFVLEISKSETGEHTNYDVYEIFKKQAGYLNDWCLLPASVRGSTRRLYPVSQAYALLKIESHFRRDITVALEKLHIPSLTLSCKVESVSDVLQRALEQLIASLEKPNEVLSCLYFHRPLFDSAAISFGQCTDILKYFSDRFRMQEWQFDKWKLKSLPVYQSKQTTAVSTETFSVGDVLVLPVDLPIDGINQWAEQAGKLLLKEQFQLQDLYKCLGFTTSGFVDFYCEYLLNAADNMEFKDLYRHMRYIKNKIDTIEEDQRIRLFRILRQVRLVPQGDGRTTVCHFKSPRNPVFKLMCSATEFPPAVLFPSEWHSFLVKLGLQTQVTATMYVQFAREIETEWQSSGITDQVQKKSQTLIESFVKESCKNFSSHQLSEISGIRFLLPGKMTKQYLQLHEQLDTNAVVCYNDSAPVSQGILCWTSMPLLPADAYPCKSANTNLAVHNMMVQEVPPFDKVVLHCQNLGDRLKTKLPEYKKKYTQQIKWISSLMEELYKYFGNQAIGEDVINRRLYHTPLIYFPEEKEILPAHMVIMDCSTAQEIPPYLRKAPVYYGKYHSLFKQLGASERRTLKHYADVSTKIKQNSNGKELFVEELATVKLVVENILDILKQNSPQVQINGELKLFLPDRNRCLVDAVALVISDNNHLEKRISKDEAICYFIGFEELEIQNHNATKLMMGLPESCRPSCLTDITEEEVDLSNLQRSRSALSCQLETFLHSGPFANGIIRLLKFKSKDNVGVTIEEEESVVASFRKISVWEVQGLKTFIKLKKNGTSLKVKGSETDTNCTICKDSSGDYVVYFKEIRSSERHFLLSKLALCIKRVVNNKIKHMYIQDILQKFDNPQQIEAVLAELKVPEYSSSSIKAETLFPEPGTFVPERLHQFLDNEYGDFEEHEFRFVAMLKEDPLIENDESMDSAGCPVYIYVHIKEKIAGHESHLFQMYWVDTGEDEWKIVPAFLLYRFIREKNTVKDVSMSDSVPSARAYNSLPLKAVFRMIRKCLRECWTRPDTERRHIIRRLWMRWHPDKNEPSQKDFCHQVFTYLQNCIQKLENGDQLESEDEMDGPSTGRPRRGKRRHNDWFTSSPYGRFFTRMNRSNFHNYHFSSSYSTSFHSERKYEPVPYPAEARRWQRQAQADLRDAKVSLEQPDSSSSWICYRCHQAVEKSLKAAWYTIDANKVNARSYLCHSHDLQSIALGLNSPELYDLAKEMFEVTGHHTRMRYPTNGGIPAELFNRDDAEKAFDKAKQVLDKVSDTYSC